MTDRPPGPLNYERRYRRKRPRRQSDPKELWIGLAIGLVSSALFWYVLIAGTLRSHAIPLAILFWTIKGFAGLVLTGSRGWNHLGKGILLSIGLLLLIGIGTCGIMSMR